MFGVKGIGVRAVVSRSISNQYPIRKKKRKKNQITYLNFLFLFLIGYTFKGIFLLNIWFLKKKNFVTKPPSQFI